MTAPPSHQPLPHKLAPVNLGAGFRRVFALAATLAAVSLPGPGLPGAAPAQEGVAGKFAGTYRIADWTALEARGLYHFFYLHPQGLFLLGAEWAGREESQAVGRWTVSGDLLSLTGTVRVKTNQGNWAVPYRRGFRIGLNGRGFRLEPLPEKNRFGMLGWPNAFVFYRPGAAPNLPGTDLPGEEAVLAALIEKLAAPQP